MTAPRTGHVAILMATRNGAEFLRAQLDSLAAQDHDDWSLWIGDDGSTDATRAIVEAFAHSHPQRTVSLRDGPRRGSMANFLSLLCAPDIRADFFALADQDDVWLPVRLSRASPPAPQQMAQRCFTAPAPSSPTVTSPGTDCRHTSAGPRLPQRTGAEPRRWEHHDARRSRP